MSWVQLDGAVILDQIVQVQEWNSPEPFLDAGIPEKSLVEEDPSNSSRRLVINTGEELDEKPAPPPPTDTQISKKLSEIIAAGYTLGQGAIEKAAEFDKQHLNVAPDVEEKFTLAVETIKLTASELDENYQITKKIDEKIESLKRTQSWQDATKKMEEIDSKYKVSDWMNSIISDVQHFKEETQKEIIVREQRKKAEAAALPALEVNAQLQLEGAVEPVPEQGSKFISFLQSFSTPGIQPEPEPVPPTQNEKPSGFASFFQSFSGNNIESPAHVPEPQQPTDPKPEQPSQFRSFFQSLSSPSLQPPVDEEPPQVEQPSKFFSFFQSVEEKIQTGIKSLTTESSPTFVDVVEEPKAEVFSEPVVENVEEPLLSKTE